MAWTPTPSDVIRQYDGGTSDMGSLTYGADSDTNSAARFGLSGVPYVLIFLRIHFSGSGTGTADLAINLDSGQSAYHDTLLLTIEAKGKGADVNFRIGLDKLCDWMFGPQDTIVLTWTNPDSPNIAWGAEVGLVEVPTNATN